MKLKLQRSIVCLATSFAILCSASVASATLTTYASFSGKAGVSVDGGGSTASTLPNGLTADIPAGSSVLAAYLYSSTYNFSSPYAAAGTVFPSALVGGTLNGTSVAYTALQLNASSCCDLQAGRANVTSIVQAAVGPVAAGGVYNFAVTETNSGNQDGEVLVVVYNNSSLPTTSIGILDGASDSSGDASSINFISPPTHVLMSIGDGFSYDLGETDQVSTITVDGSTLTTAAGNCDESQDGGTPPNATSCANGDLITAGTLGLNGDGSVNTAYSNPFTPVGDTDLTTDHELYDLSSLINPGDGNTIHLTTFNSSFNDNIFLEVFVADGLAGFNAPPPGTTPEPGTLSLLGLGLSSLGVIQRKFRNRGRN
jgi:hypothetical protein